MMELWVYRITEVSSTKIFRSLSDLALGISRKRNGMNVSKI
jgi:hypothetical protein